MPLFSIVIPVYNREEFLPACLDSLKAQTFTDWEAIVVIDASPDGCAEIAKGYADEDVRFVVIDKAENGGAHLARQDGVAAARGERITFLDADDELAPDAFERLSRVLPLDENIILHFGLSCIGDGVDENTAASFEGWANSEAGFLDRSGLLEAVFSTDSTYGKDWNVHHRVFGASHAKTAFSHMCHTRLGRGQDAYEALALMCLANGEVTHDEIKAYRYFLGRGITKSGAITLPNYVRETEQILEIAQAALDFAAMCADDECVEAAAALRERLVFTAANEWHDRVSDEDKDAGIRELARIAGSHSAATELMRFARDASYAALQEGKSYSEDGVYAKWLSLAEELVAGEGSVPGRFGGYVEAARRHIADLKARDAIAEYGNQGIRIFVSTHKDVDTFDSKILQPVQVGCANAAHRFPWALHDDEGENISFQNPMYCELTTQYWAWKNVDAEYYGFCHYRRYFDFSPKRHKENPWGEVFDSYINEASQKRYGLDDLTMRKAIEGYDCITTELKDLNEFPGEDHTPLAQYEAAPLLHIADLEHVVAILKEMHPNYAEDADAFLNGSHSCFCNMFIMRKQQFFKYCEWLFPVLERFVAETDFSLYSVEAIRTPGHLAERLLNIYLVHQARVNPDWKTKQLQCVHFTNPERTRLELSVPYGAARGRQIVPVVFAADDTYVPMVTTTIRSMLDNASSDRFYDVVVLTSNISWEHQELMRECLVGGADNVSLRFHDVSSVMCEYDLATNNAHIGIETYYRFIIQRVMPGYEKVLYLDSDLVVEGDVAELYDTELGDNLLGATIDVDYLGNLNMNDGERLEYTKMKLKMSNPYGYFQAGVLLLNLKAMREAYTTAQWLEFASVRDFIFDDQDVLNAHCEGRVTYLDQRWNVMHACGDRVSRVAPFAPAAVYKTYMEARQAPFIRHYAGCDKPWNLIGCDWAADYWKYARETPFYEDLVARLCTTGPLRNVVVDDRPAPALSENNPIRLVVDPLMPLGSRRREVAKAVGRKLRGRE